MTLLGTVLTAVSPEDAVKVIAEYGPVIEALIRFLETRRDDKQRALSMNEITRSLHNASQTGDPSQLEAAIRAHCGADGCRIP